MPSEAQVAAIKAAEIVTFRAKVGGGLAQAPRSTFEALYTKTHEIVTGDEAAGPIHPPLDDAAVAQIDQALADSAFTPDAEDSPSAKGSKKGGDQ
jgi:hypothetical protein